MMKTIIYTTLLLKLQETKLVQKYLEDTISKRNF